MLNQPTYLKKFEKKDDIIDGSLALMYRILYQLMNTNHELMKVTDDQKFWHDVCEDMTKSCEGKLGKYLLDKSKALDFSMENMMKIHEFYYGHEKELVPNAFSKKCPTSGLIFFLIKDSLEYTGITEKKGKEARTYKFYDFGVNHLKEKIAALEKMITMV